jgi:hypothetical protein
MKLLEVLTSAMSISDTYNIAVVEGEDIVVGKLPKAVIENAAMIFFLNEYEYVSFDKGNIQLHLYGLEMIEEINPINVQNSKYLYFADLEMIIGENDYFVEFLYGIDNLTKGKIYANIRKNPTPNGVESIVFLTPSFETFFEAIPKILSELTRMEDFSGLFYDS